jgi:hypothetical protein
MSMAFETPPGGGAVKFVSGPFGAAERSITLERPSTIAEIICANEVSFRLPTIAVLDGEPILRGLWNVRMIDPSDTLFFISMPKGGGGGGGGQGKQIAGLIAALALSVAAPMIGGMVAGSLFAAGTIGFSLTSSLVAGAIMVGGSLLLNALYSPPIQATSGAMASAERVYSVSAASNAATPLEAIPVLYGRLRYPPRLASRPYAEYSGNDQYLYQLFLVTLGKADVTRIEIGETEAWTSSDGYSDSFSDVEFEVVQPGDAITLFPANVVTSTEVSGQAVPDPPAVLGPFVVNAAGTSVDKLAVDFAFPGGLWTADNRSVTSNSIAVRAEYQAIDNGGLPVGEWQTLFAETISAATRTPQRMSRVAGVDPGRYRVRFLADEPFDADDGTSVNAVAWTGLRGYLTDFVTPPNCTLLAMRMRANDQLSQTSANQIRVVAERYLETWDGTEWQEQKTRSIAWAAADLLKNTDYSLGLADSAFDLATLGTLAATWAGRGDNFDAIFDREWTAQDALRAILRAGRTQAVRLGGRIGFVRLEPKTIKRAVFTPRNVIPGSFNHELVLFDEEKPDHVVGSYIDATTWQTQEVTGRLASIGSEVPQKVEWFGITDHDHAWRETVTEAAVNAYQREFVAFTAEWEGKLLVRGDPILVLHPFIEGVEGAALISRSGDVLTMDRDISAPIGGEAYVIIRGKDGREWGPCLIEAFNGRQITLDGDSRTSVSSAMGALADILPHDREELASILICDGETRPFNGLVVSATPSGANRVNVLAVVDAPEVYLADATEVMPSPWTPPVLPPQNPAMPLIIGLYAQLRAGIAQLELDASWQPAAGVIGGYVAEVSYDAPEIADAQKTWVPVYSGSANRFTEPVLPQALTLRVAAIGVLQGPWTKRTFVPGEVPRILVPPENLSLDLTSVARDVLAQLGDAPRQVIESFKRLGTLLEEADRENFDKRQTLFNEISVQLDGLEASFTSVIEVALGPGGAIAVALEALYAAMGGSTSEVNIRWEAVAAPAGYSARYAVQAAVNDGAFRSATFFVDVPSDPNQPTRIGFMAGQTVFFTSAGVPIALVDEGGLFKSANGAVVIDMLTGAFSFGVP